MTVSVASYAFHGLLQANKINLFGYLESCRYRYHLNTADIWNGMFTSLEEDYLSKVKEALIERELTLVNLCVDGPHIWEDDSQVREQNYKDALNFLGIGEKLGARTIRIDAGGHDETYSQQQFDLIIKRYREYAQRAYDNGYKVGPENHWGTEAIPENMRKICEAVDHPGFGMLLHFRGEADDALMAPWAMHTHISWEVVTGTLETSMTMLRDTGYQGSWSVEHHTGENEYAEVKVQLAQVQWILSRWNDVTNK